MYCVPNIFLNAHSYESTWTSRRLHTDIVLLSDQIAFFWLDVAALMIGSVRT